MLPAHTTWSGTRRAWWGDDLGPKHVVQVHAVARLALAAPVPVLDCQETLDGIRLDVTNAGSTALFTCEIRFLEILPGGTIGAPPLSGERFRPTWENGQPQASIPRGGTSSVWLAVRRSMGEVLFPFTEHPSRARAFSLAWHEAYEVRADGTRI